MSAPANADVRSKVIKALRRAGFVIHPGGKHTIMAHEDGRCTIIPNSKRWNPHTLKAILKQCALAEADYLRLYVSVAPTTLPSAAGRREGR